MTKKQYFPTLYDSRNTLLKVLDEAYSVLTKKDHPLRNNNGYYNIKQLCDVLTHKVDNVPYLNRNHIVELYFKDERRNIIIVGEDEIGVESYINRECSNFYIPTLYRSKEDLYRATSIIYNELKDTKSKLRDCEGYYSITGLSSSLRESEGFNYITSNHIVELYFKIYSRDLIISGEDKIKVKEKHVVEPPEYLYFGTLESMYSMFMRNGVRSKTKGYIKLHKTPDEASEYAKKFLKDRRDKTGCLKIKANKAFKEGLKFNMYDLNSEYVVSKIDPSYISLL